MAWQNVLIGYKVVDLDKDAIIPIGSTYISTLYEKRLIGWVSKLHTVEFVVGYRYQIPIYKKKNVKTK